MLADNHLPRYDAQHAQFTLVDATPQRTYEAIHETPLDEDLILSLIPRIASLANTQPSTLATLGDLLEALPLLHLDEDPPNELVLGAIAPLRDPTQPLRTDIARQDYRTFHEPHHAKLLLDIATHPRSDGTTILTIETRAQATHPKDRTQLKWTTRLTHAPRLLLTNRLLSAIRDQARRPTLTEPEPEPLTLHTHPGEIPTLDDVDPTQRYTLLRVDINTPLHEGKIRNPERLHQAATTIRTLQEKDARVAILAHQGRTGQPDCIPLEEHASILDENTPKPVEYVPHIDDEDALTAFQATEPGHAILLENVRFAEGETENAPPRTHAKRAWVERLADQAELYVNDAFPVSHRGHASLTGFPQHVPSVAGPTLARELDALDEIHDKPGPRVMALGGIKIKNSIDVALHQLTNGHIDKLLVGGLLGLLFLEAQGTDTGQGTRALLEERDAEDLLPKARACLDANEDRLELPSDVAIREGGKRFEIPIEDLPAKGGAMDIGSGTANRFADVIAHAGTVLVHGPMGVYEEPMFSRGTSQVLAAAAKGDAYSVVGGGHTVGALAESGVNPAAFDHVSMAGGALLSYLAGSKLPGVEALRSEA